MLKRIFLNFIEDRIRYISGSLGLVLRRWYYRKRLKKIGVNCIIQTGVFFQNPMFIELGNHVLIDKNVILIAGKLDIKKAKLVSTFPENTTQSGILSIGSFSKIGIGAILQAHGGIKIERYFTSSPGCKLYSFSNDIKKTNQGTIPKNDHSLNYIVSPIYIEENVWLGMNVVVVGGHIGKDCFVKAFSLIKDAYPANSIIEGNPAKVIAHRF